MSCLRLFACGGVQHVLYCVSALFSVLSNVYYIYHRNISMIKKIEGIKPCFFPSIIHASYKWPKLYCHKKK